MMRDTRPGATRSQDFVILALILALALALRLYRLNAPLWYDEITTIDTHLRLGWGEMMQTYSMNHHYLHNLAAKASMQLFGEAPWAIRLPALLFGLGSIAAMWVLVRRTVGSTLAHATALLLALSYHHIWFSQNARGYTGMAFFSTIGFYLFLRGLQDRRWRSWLWFAAAMAATIFTHLTGAFFFATLAIAWLALCVAARQKGQLDRDLLVKPFAGFLIGGIATLALYAPLLPSLLSTVQGVAETSAVDPMQEYQNPLWTAYEAIRTGVGQAGPLVTVIGLGVLVLSLLGALALRRRAPLIAPVTFGHILLSVVLLLGLGMRIWPRFFFTDIAFLLLLIVCGVQWVCEALARLTGPALGRWLFPLALSGMVLVSGAMAARNYSAPKQDLIGAYNFAEARREPGERIYSIAYAGEVYRSYFRADWGTIFTEAEYRAALDAPGPVTIVVAFPDRSFRSLPSLEADRNSGVLQVETILPGTLGDGAIVILHRDGPTAGSGGTGG